jgi:hypothetical protein
MAQHEISVLVPQWSKPQWTALGEILAGQSITLRIDAVDVDALAATFATRLEEDDPPNLVMLPTEAPECETTPAFRVIHEIANRLDAEGVVLLETDRGVALGLIPLWAYAWTLHATNLDPGVEQVLVVAGRYRDPRLPVSPVWRTSLLFHEQTYKLPTKLGGFKFEVHFPGTTDIEIVSDMANPNRGTIRVLDLEGKLPVKALGFLKKLPWPTQWEMDPERDVFSMRLHEPLDEESNSGAIDFQTGKTALILSVRVEAPFLAPVGMATIDMVIEERGRWDPLVGTLFVESGTVTLIGGLFDGLQLTLLLAAKNQRQTIRTGCTAVWQALEVEILQYGTSPASAPDLERLRKLFKKLSTRGARLAHLIAAAISVSGARSVFITYVCVVTETFQAQQKKKGKWQNVGNPYDVVSVTDATPQRVELPDLEALPWWQGGNPTRKKVSGIAIRNRPKSGCDCP